MLLSGSLALKASEEAQQPVVSPEQIEKAKQDEFFGSIQGLLSEAKERRTQTLTKLQEIFARLESTEGLTPETKEGLFQKILNEASNHVSPEIFEALAQKAAPVLATKSLLYYDETLSFESLFHLIANLRVSESVKAQMTRELRAVLHINPETPADVLQRLEEEGDRRTHGDITKFSGTCASFVHLQEISGRADVLRNHIAQYFTGEEVTAPLKAIHALLTKWKAAGLFAAETLGPQIEIIAFKDFFYDPASDDFMRSASFRGLCALWRQVFKTHYPVHVAAIISTVAYGAKPELLEARDIQHDRMIASEPEVFAGCEIIHLIDRTVLKEGRKAIFGGDTRADILAPTLATSRKPVLNQEELSTHQRKRMRLYANSLSIKGERDFSVFAFGFKAGLGIEAYNPKEPAKFNALGYKKLERVLSSIVASGSQAHLQYDAPVRDDILEHLAALYRDTDFSIAWSSSEIPSFNVLFMLGHKDFPTLLAGSGDIRASTVHIATRASAFAPLPYPAIMARGPILAKTFPGIENINLYNATAFMLTNSIKIDQTTGLMRAAASFKSQFGIPNLMDLYRVVFEAEEANSSHNGDGSED